MFLCELTRTAILALIPHRDPFFFLENAKVKSEKEISGQALWSKTHPILQGNFARKNVIPGSFLIESGAQLAGTLLSWRNKDSLEIKNGLGVLAKVHKARFHHQLLQDQLLELQCQVRTITPNAFYAHCSGTHSNALIFESELLIAHISYGFVAQVGRQTR